MGEAQQKGQVDDQGYIFRVSAGLGELSYCSGEKTPAPVSLPQPYHAASHMFDAFMARPAVGGGRGWGGTAVGDPFPAVSRSVADAEDADGLRRLVRRAAEGVIDDER